MKKVKTTEIDSKTLSQGQVYQYTISKKERLQWSENDLKREEFNLKGQINYINNRK